jgi:hypothetical protein
MLWNEEEVRVVRKMADRLWRSDEEVLLPGREVGVSDEREAAVRAAAEAVLGREDAGYSRITGRQMGALMHYLVDMLEP